jgi:tRNA-binding protein
LTHPNTGYHPNGIRSITVTVYTVPMDNNWKPSEVKPTISIDLLEQLDIRVGTIVAVKDVPASAKLLKLTVDFGDHNRTILAGIKKERSDPKEIEGKQALFVVNLPPRKMAGETSEGMLFDIGYADGVTPVLAVPEKSVPNGTRAQ